LLGSFGSLGIHLTNPSSPKAMITAYNTISTTTGGVLNDLIVVISSYLIFSSALEASSNNGNTLAKSLSQESLNSLASFFYILVILSYS